MRGVATWPRWGVATWRWVAVALPWWVAPITAVLPRAVGGSRVDLETTTVNVTTLGGLTVTRAVRLAALKYNINIDMK